MKRQMLKTSLKNAPDIDMDSLAPAATGKREPAAPAVNDLISRLGNVVGSKITLPVCGQDVVFTLKVIPAAQVERATMVWTGNERLQDLLTEKALDDLIPSFTANGQQNPAFGRNVNGVIEIADGSRRRMTAIITGNDYRVLVGDLNEEQMAALSTIGNEYRATSAYERGLRYQRLLTGFNGEIKALAEAEKLSRKVISRCLNTAKLPREIIALFANPGELSARAGDALSRIYETNEDSMFALAMSLSTRQANGETWEADELVKMLADIAPPKDKPAVRVLEYRKGITAKYKGDDATFELKSAPTELVQQIEKLLEAYKEK
jgi:ParB family chromosome partitioning protein